jgi:hypothetical protein
MAHTEKQIETGFGANVISAPIGAAVSVMPEGIDLRRRQLSRVIAASALFGGSFPAFALSWSDISNTDATAGLKGALSQSSLSAISFLGRENGFFGNDKVRIPLPGALQDAAKIMKKVGYKKQVEELELSMNRAAEAAVPEAKEMFVNAVKQMTVTDAKNILTGGNNAGTQYFKGKTQTPLVQRFLPIVKKATANVGLAQKYNEYAGQAASLKLLKGDAVNIESWVTRKALDGLYLIMGEEEAKLRANPLGASTDIVKKVFGALGK